MKKKELETLEKINKERKLDKETKEQIRKKVFKNFIFAAVILLFFAVLRLMAINLEKQLATLIYKEISVGVFIITLILFEVAYKKDSDSLAITSIEMLFVSVITLLAPYILINRVNAYTSSVGVFFAIYYSVKNFIIYRNEKNEYLKEKNDINQIIKKESKDELAQQQLEKIRKEKETKVEKVTINTKNTKTTSKKSIKDKNKTAVEEKQNETVTPKKRGRPRKTTNTETTTTKSTPKTTVKTETSETTPPKRKRGRPKKVNN